MIGQMRQNVCRCRGVVRKRWFFCLLVQAQLTGCVATPIPPLHRRVLATNQLGITARTMPSSSAIVSFGITVPYENCCSAHSRRCLRGVHERIDEGPFLRGLVRQDSCRDRHPLRGKQSHTHTRVQATNLGSGRAGEHGFDPEQHQRNRPHESQWNGDEGLRDWSVRDGFALILRINTTKA